MALTPDLHPPEPLSSCPSLWTAAASSSNYFHSAEIFQTLAELSADNSSGNRDDADLGAAVIPKLCAELHSSSTAFDLKCYETSDRYTHTLCVNAASSIKGPKKKKVLLNDSVETTISEKKSR